MKKRNSLIPFDPKQVARWMNIGIQSVPCPPGRKKGTGRKPWPKQCFARAGMYQGAQPDVILVHALILGGIIHAWCELPEGVLFDGSRNLFYDTMEYRNNVDVIKEVRYTSLETAQKLQECAENHGEMFWDAWDKAALYDAIRPTEGR